MPKSDLVLIGHMLDAASRAFALIAERSRDEFMADDILQLAIVHLIQIVGEAAWKTSAEFQQQHPELPWREMTGMRHKIVHDYFEINLRVVWDVATVDLLALIEQLKPIVSGNITQI